MYKTWLLACGYNQVSRVDFVKIYSPIVNKIMFCILLLMVIHFGFLAKIIEIITTFLYRDSKEEIYMECPLGMTNMSKDDWFVLSKFIYDLIEAAMQYKKRPLRF